MTLAINFFQTFGVEYEVAWLQGVLIAPELWVHSKPCLTIWLLPFFWSASRQVLSIGSFNKKLPGSSPSPSHALTHLIASESHQKNGCEGATHYSNSTLDLLHSDPSAQHHYHASIQVASVREKMLGSDEISWSRWKRFAR